MAGAAVQRALLDAWRHRGVPALLLWPLSQIYRAMWHIRLALYRGGICRAQRIGVPVIVVGNVVVGGGGKTPVVMALVAHLLQRGLRPGVITRGYGRTARDCRAVQADSKAGDVGDEPLLIKRATGVPVFVAAARADAAGALLAAHPEVDLLVADDGLQHLALRRDIEICVFDEGGSGNGYLFPAGPLREPWPRPTDLVLFAGDQAPQPGAFRVRRELAPYGQRADGSRVQLDTLATQCAPDKPLRAVAGTARPDAFFAMLRERGLQLATTRALPDHAAFDPAHWKENAHDTLLCTEKDAVKLWQHRPDALAVPLLVRPDPAFWTSLEQLLRERGSAQLRAKLSSAHGHTAT